MHALVFARVALLMFVAFVAPAWAQSQPSAAAEMATEPATGPIRLRQGATPQGNASTNQVRQPPSAPMSPEEFQRQTPKPYRLGEFELFVRKLAAQPTQEVPGIRRLGGEILLDSRLDSTDSTPAVPADYVISVGDEVLVTLWGSVEAELRLVVDRTGRIQIPRVGPILVAGLTLGELPAVVNQRVAAVFRNFQSSATLGQLRPIRIFATGFVQSPGVHSMGSLSTLLQALVKAGGPSAGGSFRQVELRRAGKLVSTIDLYDMLVNGDISGDRRLRADDVVHVGPVGAQVGVIGSVNLPAVVEVKATETVADVLRLVGGFSAVADRSRLTVERIDLRNKERVLTLNLPTDAGQPVRGGDVFRAFSAVDVELSSERPNRRVRIEGEVRSPGEYILPPNSTLQDAIKAAGGLTQAAYLYGADFSRESVRITQQENYERALRDLHTETTRAASTQKTGSADEAAAQAGRIQATNALLERLRMVKPTGRIVLQTNPKDPRLPELTLEDGDRLYIPSTPTSVGIFGSVFNAGNYLFQSSRKLDDYLRLAGGPTRGADEKSIFVLRANGGVQSARQASGRWFTNEFATYEALPGDTLFVPEEMEKTTFLQSAKEWTQILYQFGLGAAGLKTLRGF